MRLQADQVRTVATGVQSKGVAAALVTILFWSTAFAGIRVALVGYSPTHLTLLRFVVASLVFVVAAFVTRLPWPAARDWPRLISVGLFGVTIYHLCLNFGQQAVTAGTASFIISTSPVFTALLSFVAYRERLRVMAWIGLVISLAGVLIMATAGGQGVEFARGSLLILLSAVSSAFYMVLQRPLFSRYRPLQIAAYFTWAGTVPLFVFAPGMVQAVQSAPMSSTLAAIYIGVFPAAIAYVTWSTALSQMPSGRAASFLYLNPLAATLVGFLWLGERPDAGMLLGGVVALGGVLLTNAFGRQGR